MIKLITYYPVEVIRLEGLSVKLVEHLGVNEAVGIFG